MVKPQIAFVYLIRIYISIHDINRIVMIDPKYMQYCWSSTVKIIFKQRNSEVNVVCHQVFSNCNVYHWPQGVTATQKKTHTATTAASSVCEDHSSMGGDESRWMGACFAWNTLKTHEMSRVVLFLAMLQLCYFARFRECRLKTWR